MNAVICIAPLYIAVRPAIETSEKSTLWAHSGEAFYFLVLHGCNMAWASIIIIDCQAVGFTQVPFGSLQTYRQYHSLCWQFQQSIDAPYDLRLKKHLSWMCLLRTRGDHKWTIMSATWTFYWASIIKSQINAFPRRAWRQWNFECHAVGVKSAEVWNKY